MKPTTLFLALMLLFSGCQLHHSPTPLAAANDTTLQVFVPTLPLAYMATTNSSSITAADSSSATPVDPADAMIQAELDYYLERHNVQDEGYEMVAAYSQRRDTMLALMPAEPTTVLGIGRWSGVDYEGTAVECDSAGHIIIGTYACDTLNSGFRLDSASVYAGHFSSGMADGHGFSLSDSRLYYEGQWQYNRRHGFGFSVAPDSHVRVGQWQDDRYLGERMRYSSKRIYGIDISRYQHGKGRKKYPIYWDRLRITHLGKNQKHATGTVNYPVSFVFIKSTESTYIHNPYYAKDYQQARRRGIPIGAYHYFSCRTSGAAQAQYFLRNTQFRRGDLPPVLDIEPTQRQVASMGGTAALFKHVRAWLNAVERVTHVRPIIYVSQQFVNRYLGEAPDLKRNYPVWIARYGEYKPDVKLTVWQLSPNGRVNGIHGEVDINVFNGYDAQFEEFLKEETIK